MEDNVKQEEKVEKPKKIGFFRRNLNKYIDIFKTNLFVRENKGIFSRTIIWLIDFFKIFSNKRQSFNSYEDWARYLGIKEEDSYETLAFTLNCKNMMACIVGCMALFFAYMYGNFILIRVLTVFMGISLVFISTTTNIWMKENIKTKTYISYGMWLLKQFGIERT